MDGPLLGRFSDGQSINDNQWKVDGNEWKTEDNKRKKDGNASRKKNDTVRCIIFQKVSLILTLDGVYVG